MPPNPPKRLPPTHFLCIPLVTAPSLARWRTSMDAFRADATGITPGSAFGSTSGSTASSSTTNSSPTRPRLPESAVRPLHSVHLTLGVMSLETEEKLDGARAALEALDVRALLRAAAAEVGGGGGDGGEGQGSDGKGKEAEEGDESDSLSPLIISLQSLHAMQSPTSTSVLYAQPIDPTSRLVPFCQHLVAHFTTSGVMTPDMRPLKLHATVMNTLQARRDWAPKKKKLPAGWGRPGGGDAGEEEGKGKGAIDAYGKIDGRELIARWADRVWVDGLRLERVAICELGVKRDERDGMMKYRELVGVALP